MSTQAPSAGDLQTRLIRRAMADDTFRQQLLTSPKKAIEQELGAALPVDLEVMVVEETASRVCLVLPAKNLESGELSDAELSGVSGGGIVIEERLPLQTLGFARLDAYSRRFVSLTPEND